AEEDHEVRKKCYSTHASRKARNNLTKKALSRVFSEEYHLVKKTIYDPRGPAIHTWNSIFFAASLASLFLDPLFFLLPQVREEEICISVSTSIQVALTAIRSLTDMFYIIHILVRFRTAYVAPSSRVIGRGELVVDPSKIASRYLRKQFWLDTLAAQPIPQVLIWIVIPCLKGSSVGGSRYVLVCILTQCLLRLYLIVPLCAQITKATGVVLETAWAGAAFNLLLYLLASHIFGCLWYLLAIGRQEDCWREMCGLENTDCQLSFLDCRRLNDPDRVSWLRSTQISSTCNPNLGSFDFGIYSVALTSGVTSEGFVRTFFFCLWWALRNLNSLGQDLATSTYPGEINFAIVFGIVSLVLFGLLVGNMQTYLQSTTARLERWRIWKSDTELWMHHRQLPQELRQKVRRHNQHNWCTTRGVDEQIILKTLPVDLRRVIKRHLCLDLVRKVPFFNMMEEHMLDAICEKLKPCLYDKGTCLDREGYPVCEMLFIVRGRLDSYTTGGGRTDFFNSSLIGPGDFCGEELLTWALDPRQNSILPSSTRTVIAITEVEAFALRAKDLKRVAPQFRRQINKPLRHVFRFHSHQWRTWAACSIQAAWFRYKKRKEAAAFERMQQHASGKTSTSLLQVATNFTIYAAKLAASTRRGGISKPEEPDFTLGN
ncbi:hypothetical protein Tsubulata_000157, partial [Turnera subulata]